jgi:hypothetical protein
MKYTFLLSILIFFATVLDASYARSIRVNSYTNKSNAEKALEKLDILIDNSDVLSKYQQEMEFKTSVVKSGKYYMLELKPFTDKQIVQKTLDTLRETYKYVYPKKIKLNSNIVKEQEVYVPKERQKVDRTEVIEKIDSIIQESDSPQEMERVEYIKPTAPTAQVRAKRKITDYPQLPLKLPTLKYTYLDDGKNIQTKNYTTITDKSNDKLTVFKEYVFEMIIAAAVIIFILLFILFYKMKKTRENKITIQEIYT